MIATKNRISNGNTATSKVTKFVAPKTASRKAEFTWDAERNGLVVFIPLGEEPSVSKDGKGKSITLGQTEGFMGVGTGLGYEGKEIRAKASFWVSKD